MTRPPAMNYQLRTATMADCGAIESLVAISARTLGRNDYSAEQIEGALAGAFGLDTQLIEDGSYFIVEARDELVGCGGWSRRATLFGSDHHRLRDATTLDPATDAARIRAFFVHPKHARCGIGRMLLEHCEREARRMGFVHFELMATLPGKRLYQAYGYQPDETVHYPLGDGLTIPFVAMSKRTAAR